MPDPFSSHATEPSSPPSISAETTTEIDSAPAPTPGARPVRPEPPARDPVAVELGRRGGLKGGKARAAQLSPEQRKAIAMKAAQARWGIKVPVAQEVIAAVAATPVVIATPADAPMGELGVVIPTPADVLLEESEAALATPADVALDQPVMAADAPPAHVLLEESEAALATPAVPQLAVLPLTVRGASASADWPSIDLQSARVTESLAWRLAPGPGCWSASPGRGIAPCTGSAAANWASRSRRPAAGSGCSASPQPGDARVSRGPR